MPGLESLPLHDALVNRITLHWQECTVAFELLAFAEAGKDAIPHQLQFTSVNNFSCPHLSPCEESFYIKWGFGSAGRFTLEMQSGDKIEIEAAAYSFLPTAS